MMSEENLRTLIRFLAPLTMLRQDLERAMALEFEAALGATAVRTYNGLHTSITRVLDDPYLEALALQVPETANDKEKISLVFLAVGQLLAVVHGAIGLPVGWGSPSTEIQTAPYVIINAQGSSPDVAKHVMKVVHRALGEDEGEAA
jgi:hypothetical protein